MITLTIMIKWIITPLVGLIITGMIFMFKKVLIRMDKIEEKNNTQLSSTEVRVLIKDHIEPITSHIVRIEDKIDKIFWMMMQNSNNNK